MSSIERFAFTEAEVATALAISHGAVLELTASGQLRSFVIEDGRWGAVRRISGTELTRFVAEATEAAIRLTAARPLSHAAATQ